MAEAAGRTANGDAMIDPELRAELLELFREAFVPTNRYSDVDAVIDVLENVLRNTTFPPGHPLIPNDIRIAAIRRRDFVGDGLLTLGLIGGNELVAVLRQRLQRERGMR